MTPDLILVAEDDSDIRDLLTVALESAGFRAVTAKDGHTAARILTVARPAGLITDVRIPAVSGLELCRLARLEPDGRDTAIVMISANTRAHDADAGFSAGADRYLPKPLSPRRLVAELRDLLAERALNRTAPAGRFPTSACPTHAFPTSPCPTRAFPTSAGPTSAFSRR
ncbi:response regulator [Actinoplanes solisilvae]|uniref:response regulator n=1 Tax=Actinoplanes solisilvae TaxID=2486853 RepID=UPI00196A3151|nr:response regulator [Actinoplanes solisilvae]